MRHHKLHGRFENGGRLCERPGCEEAGEFRAPGARGPGFDGPGEWRWFCLEHVREFNTGYDWFAGMSADEIYAAQAPGAGWASETRAFRAGPGGLGAGVDGMPRWADFADPLDAIGGRASDIKSRARRTGQQGWGPDPRRPDFHRHDSRIGPREREALTILGLTPEADRQTLRRRYSELVRRYHPDRNGGDRSQETRLTRVVEAYQLLCRTGVFS